MKELLLKYPPERKAGVRMRMKHMRKLLERQDVFREHLLTNGT